MTAPTASTRRAFALSALTAVALLTASAAAVAQDPGRASTVAARPCSGPVTTVAWGAYVGDAQGRCARSAPVSAPRPAATVQRPESCANERRWLGGAVRICRDAPHAEGRR